MPTALPGARDRIREHFVACFRLVACNETRERRHRLIKGLLELALEEFDRLILEADRSGQRGP